MLKEKKTSNILNSKDLDKMRYFFKGFIKGLDLYRLSLSDFSIVDDLKYAQLEIHGGFNGSGDWSTYFLQMKKIIELFEDAYVVKIDIDCPDDVWWVSIKIPAKNS